MQFLARRSSKVFLIHLQTLCTFTQVNLVYIEAMPGRGRWHYQWCKEMLLSPSMYFSSCIKWHQQTLHFGLSLLKNSNPGSCLHSCPNGFWCTRKLALWTWPRKRRRTWRPPQTLEWVEKSLEVWQLWLFRRLGTVLLLLKKLWL